MATGRPPLSGLTPELLLAAHTKYNTDLSMHLQGLQWLCHTAGKVALASPTLHRQLLRIPEPHPDIVRALSKGGLRVRFDQLVSLCSVACTLPCANRLQWHEAGKQHTSSSVPRAVIWALHTECAILPIVLWYYGTTVLNPPWQRKNMTRQSRVTLLQCTHVYLRECRHAAAVRTGGSCQGSRVRLRQVGQPPQQPFPGYPQFAVRAGRLCLAGLPA
jgi:hypothetical protein